jgi:hypothetical protein
METIKVKSWDDIPGDFTGVAEFLNNSKEWFKEGKWHREDGPAVEHINGYKEWWVNGKRHRINGPAIENSNGAKEWWIEDELYTTFRLKGLIRFSLFLGKQKGKYNLDWLKFLTEQGIKEFPIVLEMETYEPFIPLFGKVLEVC